MRILVVGSGGREHAITWKLKQNPDIERIFIAPGNGGTNSLGENINLKENDISALTDFALKNSIDLVIPGPELPLTLGIADAMTAAGVKCFGPTAACARLEGSKAFAKEIMQAAHVPTAASGVFTKKDYALEFIRQTGLPIVIKADGLAAGKGVIIAQTQAEANTALDQMLTQKLFGPAGQTVLLEEFLQGEEVSLLCFCDGECAIPLPSAQDHKAIFDGDQGPNTGGMGAYSPAPILPPDQLEAMTDLTVRPVIKEMSRRGTPFTGILYAGLMITPQGPKVLEYNVRFGDPECQPLMMRLESDLTDLMLACIKGDLQNKKIAIRQEASVGVVLCAAGYPGAYSKGMSVTDLEKAEALGAVKVFLAGTGHNSEGYFSSGGRVLCVTALGHDLPAARNLAYLAIKEIHMDSSHYRTDIGQKGLKFIKKD
jgi:phosphoribosylamine--glycine ligase